MAESESQRELGAGNLMAESESQRELTEAISSAVAVAINNVFSQGGSSSQSGHPTPRIPCQPSASRLTPASTSRSR